MHPFWKDFVSPLLDVLEPKTIIEVGAERGKNTINLIEFCKNHGGIVHAIDPSPLFDVDQWRSEHEGFFVLHKGTSLQKLTDAGPSDVVFLDGDHNWYTVNHELKMLRRIAEDTNTPFPVVLLHDIGWPYGRRDLYYDPSTIPEPFRHPYARAGIIPGRSELHPEAGVNGYLFNATTEGGERNGVLTAVEDFVLENSGLELVHIPGFHDMGILYRRELAEQTPALTDLLSKICPSDNVVSFLREVELSRVRMAVSLNGAKTELARKEKECQALRQRAAQPQK